MYFSQLVVAGLLGGAILGLVGVGFTVVIGVGKIANFSHGSFVGAGMYLGYWSEHSHDISPYLILVPGIVAFALIGWAVAEMFQWRGRKIGEIGELLVGLALLLLINGYLELQFGTNPRTLTSVQLGHVDAFGLEIQGTQIVAAVVTLVIAVGLYLFIKLTRLGRALKAVALNPAAAGLHGIRVPVAQRVAVVASVVIAGITGILISPFYTLTPSAGTAFLISAFAVVIVGHIGNTLGAVLAGLAIGVVQSLATGYLSSAWTTLTPLILILAFLLVRPLEVDQ